MEEESARARREFLRHAVATLAYRAEKVLREAPEGFAERRAGPASRTPLEILSHLGDLLDWAVGLAHGEQRWEPARDASWTEARDRFFKNLAALDESLV